MTNVLVTVLAGVFDPPPQAPVVPWSYLGAILACAAVAVIIGTTVAIRIARRSPACHVAGDVSAVGRHRLLVAVAAVVILIGAVIVSRDLRSGSASGKNASTQTASSSAASATSAASGYPGMPPVVDPANVYSEIGPGRLRPEIAG